jgi:hypothetical protein
MLIDTTTHPYFVPDGESRKDAAILLVGTADEAGLDPNSVVAVPGGFRVSQEVSDLLDGLEPYVDPLEVAVAEALAAKGEVEVEVEVEVDEEPESDLFDPADYAIAHVKEFVDANPELAADVLTSEVAGKNRTSLVEWLQSTTTSG